jgi:restriction system protein
VSNRNANSPRNPAHSIDISPEEYEVQVVTWLRQTGATLARFEVEHLKRLEGAGGDYEFDAVAEFTILNGAEVRVVVECKRYSQPVERDKVLSLWAKLQDVRAHKAMMFATCGFQSGALEYAKTYGIATIAFVDGRFLYETKGLDTPTSPPAWLNLPKYAGIFMTQTDNGNVRCRTVDDRNPEAIAEWLDRNQRPGE